MLNTSDLLRCLRPSECDTPPSLGHETVKVGIEHVNRVADIHVNRGRVAGRDWQAASGRSSVDDDPDLRKRLSFIRYCLLLPAKIR